MRAPETWGLFSLVRSQAIVCLVCVATAIASPAQTLTTLASFNFADGAEPDVALAQSRDGNLYGMTGAGGLNSAGTVFKLDPAAGTLTTVYNFCSQAGCTDGARPHTRWRTWDHCRSASLLLRSRTEPGLDRAAED